MLALVLRKLSPWGHARFERWSSLAAVGELTADQVELLEAHVAGCSRCREYLEGAMQASLLFAPSQWEKRRPAVSVMPPEGMRARFLQRLQQDGTALDDDRSAVELTLPLVPFSKARRGTVQGNSGRWTPTSRALRPLPIAASVVLAAGLLLTGYYAGSKLHRVKTLPSGNASGTTSETRPTQLHADAAADSHELLLRSVLADLNRERSAAATEKRTLEEKLAATDARLLSLERDNMNAVEQKQAADREANGELGALRKENESLRQRIAEKETFLALKDRRTKELESELQVARDSLQNQEEGSPTKGQLGDLVTARNLHIVDVYDAEGGQRKPAFGRVFYVEGKSLLFYAYDLQKTKQAKANVVFHVWGGRAGAKEITHSLGILRNDELNQGLWTMTFDDPAVLRQINSVYVTAEASNRRDLIPHGKKILYAFLSSPPNHP